jgi:L-lactate dehydrogenase
MPTIGIIGMGWVGSSVAASILHGGFADTLLLNDVRPELAEGEAMDLAHGAPFYPQAHVGTASISEMRDADVVVISAGRGGGPDQSRLELVTTNTEIIRSIGGELAGARGVVVVVTNPVDVLTHVMVEATGLPAERVIGTGTMLETARLRQILGRKLFLDPRSIHAQVVGEHGDSNVILWSSALIGGTPLREWEGWSAEIETSTADEVTRAAYEIIRRKGATNHAIGMVTATLIRWLLSGSRRVLTVSRLQSDVAGVKGVALSMPTLVGRDGAMRVIEPQMDQSERTALIRSAEVIRDSWTQISTE